MELDPKFREFEERIVNEGSPDVAPIPPRGGVEGGGQGGMITDLQRLFMETAKTEDTSEYSYNTRDVSKKYAVTYKGVDNEEVYGQGQTWGNKMVNAVGKGLLLTGTTFLQSTAGLVNGVVAGLADGKFSSFYDNEMNRNLDAINKEAEENWLPNYYTQAERDAKWYSPTKLLSANFFWDGIIKNLGFAAGAALSGGVYSAALKAIPLTAKLFASGKAAATLAATEEGLLAANKVAGAFGKIKSLSDKFVTGYASMNVGGRAIVAGLATTGEAGFEAYNNAKEFREQKIQEYKDTHSGLAPTELELQGINQLADEVGNSSFLLNSALLTATNYIQFPKILGSSARVEKGLVSAATKEIREVAKDAAGNLIVAPARYGKVLGFIKKAAPYAFSASEAFEEGAQFAISSATQDYYNKKLKGDSANFADSLIEGVSKTLTTDEGMENLLIGGLSGAMMSARGRYQEESQKTADTAKFVTEANKYKISGFTKETVDSINRGTILQEEREKYLRQGDTLMSKESERDYLINYLTPRIKYGRLDLVKSDIEDLRLLASTEDGFNQLVREGKVLDGDTRPAFLQRLTNLEETANSMDSLYQSLTLRYGNMVNNKNQPLYNQEVMSKMIYAASKVADYDVRIPQLSGELAKEGIDVNSVMDGLAKGEDEAFNKALTNIDALKVIDDKKVDLKIALQDVKDLTQRRQEFLKEYDEIKKNPEKFSAPVLTEEEKKAAAIATAAAANQPKKTIKIKTKVGEKDFETGTEYFLGKTIFKDKDGKEVYAFPRLTILEENEDGTIKIKDSNGLVRDVSKDVLAGYRLHKVSDVATNENASFYLRNMNKVVFWNRGKNKGGEVEGRLEYDDNGKLYFVYKDKAGRPQEKEVGLDVFKAKPGFKDGIFRFGETLTKEDLDDIEKREASGKSKEDIDSRRSNRLKILSDLFDEVSDKLTSTNNLIQQKRAQFEKIVNDLAKLSDQIKAGELTKTNTFKKTTNNAIKAANKLSRMQEDLRLEIEKLEAEKEQLEINQAYIFDLSEGLDEFSSDGNEFLKELQNEKDVINDLVIESGLAINSLSKLLDNVEGALKTAIDFALELIKKFEAKYPNLPYTPLGIRDFLNSTMVVGYEPSNKTSTYKTYLQANPNLLSDLTEFERDIADIDELDVIPNERSVAELKDEMQKLYDKINEAEKQLQAKSLVLDRFNDIAAKYKKQQAEEKAFAKDTKLREEFIGTNTDEVETLIAEDLRNYEAAAKKADLEVVGGTSPMNVGKAHQIRANNFGFRLPKIDPNGDEIFGIVVTENTEKKLGLEGLMKHIYPEDSKTVIALVMVRKDEYGTYSLVDEFGETIAPGSDMINNAIYQVFPEKKLTATYNGKLESMFRNATAKERKDTIEALSEQFGKWRDARLAETTLGKARSINASFGVPDYVKQLKPDGTEGPIDYAARTSATEAGLISEDDLANSRVFMFSTTNDAVSNGSVTFETPLGRVFLKVPGGLVKLFNRRFNKKEAEVMFDVMNQAAKNAVDDKSIKTERTQLLFNWLKSVTYWGIAKNMQTGVRKDQAGYNNIWFEDVTDDKGVKSTRLFISGKGGSFAFTPSSLEANKTDIISLLQNLYFNANATMATREPYNKKYKQIVGIDKNGNPQYVTWENYQTFLLSSKGRTKDEIPFATVLKPQTDPNAVNRRDIYFKIRDIADDYVLPVATPVVTQSPVGPAATTTGGTKAVDNSAKIAKLKEVKELVNTTDDVNFKLDKIFEVLNEVAYEAWLPDAARANAAEIKTISESATDELELGNALNKFLLPKFIDEQIDKLEKEQAAPAAGETKAQVPGVYELNGTTSNTYYLKNDKGAIRFKADINKYDPVTKTMPLSFESADEATTKHLTDTFKTEAVIKAKIAGSIMLALQPQIDAHLASQAIAAAPFVPVVTAPVVETKTPASTETTTTSDIDTSAPFDTDDDDGWNDQPIVTPDNKAYRIQLANQINNYVREDWDKIEKFIKEKLSFLPFYRVKNVIQATNGRQAFGMFHKGAIYVYENAEVGTAYHEVFEAVWKMFTDPKEQKAILAEFKKRKGTFVDRETQTTVNYKDATPYQIKEQLAEEFRDFVLTNRNVAKPTYGKSLISRMFAELVNFIRELFYGPTAQTNTANLFAKIGNGYYKNYVPYESSLGFAQNGIIDIDQAEGDQSSEFRLDNIPAVQQHEIIQNMTYSTLSTLSKTNKDLFSTSAINKTELYDRLKKETKQLIRWQSSQIEQSIKDGLITKAGLPKAQADINALRFLFKNVEADWVDIVEKHKEHLKNFSVEFDENDDIEIKDEDKGKDTPYGDSRKIDGFRKANSAIKLIIGTLPVMKMTAEGPDIKRTSMGGVMLLPSDKAFITVMSKLHDSVNIDDMLNKLRLLAEGNPDYVALYERITRRSIGETGIDYSQLNNDYDLQLITSFWRTFKKQNADVRIVFVLPSGDVVIGDSTLASAAKQARVEMTNSMIKAIKANPIYLKYDEKARLYQPQAAISQHKLNPTALSTYTKLLENIGIEFDPARVAKMSDKQQLAFRDAVQGIRSSLIEATDVGSLNSKSLQMDGQLLVLGSIKAVLDNPEFESTYFNLNGERAQTFIGTNAVSDLYDVLFKIRGLNELTTNEAYSQYKYLTTDNFAKGSNLLKRMFNLNDAKGTRRDETQDLLKTAYVDGTVNEENGKKKESSKLNLKERIIQEINLNLDGYYMHLVPGDASIEWMSKLGNAITEDMLAGASIGPDGKIQSGSNYEDVYEIFREYFMSEIQLSREERAFVQDEGKTRTSRDLRFFKNIIDNDKIHNAIISKANDDLIPEQVYKKYKTDIERAVKAFIEKETIKTEETLRKYGVIFETEKGTAVENLSFSKDETISQEDLTRNLKALTINYMIANIELHKLVYSDPYQYKDELKRIKNFLSPRTPLIADSKLINEALDNTYNKDFQEKDDIGRTDFVRDYFRSITLADVTAFSDLFGYVPYKETDGGGYITMKANRNFRLRAGQWNSDEEKQYKFDVKFEKLVKSGASKEEIKKFLKGNPGIMSAYTPLKPIVSGNKRNGRTYNDILLDKFALVPQSFRILYEINPESNALKLYNKMQAEDIDYAVFASGRKVGAEKIHNVYDGDKFNDAPFETPNEKLTPDEPQGVTFVPYSIVSIQAEVPSKEAAYVTQGSQITKLATMDFMEAGVPVDFEPTLDFDDRFVKWMDLSEDEKMKSELYKEIKRNQELLEEKIEEGFRSLIKDLGIKQTETTIVDVITNEKRVVKSFTIEDKDKLADTLKDEVLKREVNDNIIEAFNGFKKGDIVLEATPAYQQIKNVLYSIADKRVISPKITGGQKVQIASSFLESERIYKSEKGAYQNDLLKFYKNANGERVCEIMVGRWFKSNKSDQELLDEWYTTDKDGKKTLTEEGAKVLSGIGFRIPTQKQNSIDSFVIKKFLPSEFGDSVVIPSELVQKSGSDFDIDKLSLYFKNLFKDSKGNLNLVERKGSREETIAYYSKVFDEILEGSKIKKAELFEAVDILTNSLADPKNLLGKYGNLLDVMLEEYQQSENLAGELKRELEKLEDTNLQAELREKYATQMYKKALENEYIQSLQNLVSHPLNFDNLIKPNSAEQLQDLAKDINKKLGRDETDYSSTGNMLSRTFMTELRQAFVSGKYAIGIAATAQTLQAQFQRFSGYVDYDKLEETIDADKKWLGDGKIKFAEFNSVNVPGKGRMPSLSMINNAERSEKYPKGQTITDIIAQFIDGYVDIAKSPWIMQLGATPNVTGTWLFLAKIGVPIKTVAYFMNQPIVRQYLNEIESNGYSYMFIDRFFNELQEAYKPSEEITITELPNETDLGKMVSADFSKMSPLQKAQQQFILGEFVKYGKMAEHLFHVTQGSNFDTAVMNDPFLVFKKMMQLIKARKTMISSVDDVLDSSFVGFLKNAIFDVRDAFSTILMSDKQSVRKVLEDALLPYVELNDKEFIKISQKIVNDLFDWAVQTDRSFNSQIEEILLGKGDVKSASAQIMDLQKKVLADKEHPLFNNMIINSIREQPGGKEGAPNNLLIAGKGSKVYDQNLLIYSFRELKKHLGAEGNDLYKKLVRLAVIQSGLTNSPISFTSLLPYEDFKDEYNETISKLDIMPNLAQFNTLNVFERNNWNNTSIVASGKAKWKKSVKGKWYSTPSRPSEITFVDKKLKNAINKGVVPQLIQFSTMSSEGRSEFVTFSWEKGEYSKEQKKLMRKKSDYSYIVKGLFKKVYGPDGTPFIQTSKDGDKIYESFVYKMVNAWGDSFRANEFYLDTIPSKLENGFIKVEAKNETITLPGTSTTYQKLSSAEVSDDVIVDIYNGGIIIKQEVAPTVVESTKAIETIDMSRRTIKLKDGITYSFTMVKAPMLNTMGYNSEESNDILNSIC